MCMGSLAFVLVSYAHSSSNIRVIPNQLSINNMSSLVYTINEGFQKTELDLIHGVLIRRLMAHAKDDRAKKAIEELRDLLTFRLDGSVERMQATERVIRLMSADFPVPEEKLKMMEEELEAQMKTEAEVAPNVREQRKAHRFAFFCLVFLTTHMSEQSQARPVRRTELAVGASSQNSVSSASVGGGERQTMRVEVRSQGDVAIESKKSTSSDDSDEPPTYPPKSVADALAMGLFTENYHMQRSDYTDPTEEDQRDPAELSSEQLLAAVHEKLYNRPHPQYATAQNSIIDIISETGDRKVDEAKAAARAATAEAEQSKK
jgi:hypothetical protein